MNRPGISQQFQNRYGIPYWERARDFSNQNNRLVFIPILDKTTSGLQAILIVYFNPSGKIQFKTLDRRKLNSYPRRADIKNPSRELSFEYVVMQFILFQYHLTNKFDCELIALLDSKDNSKDCELDGYTYSEWGTKVYSADGELQYQTFEWEIEFTYICGGDPVEDPVVNPVVNNEGGGDVGSERTPGEEDGTANTSNDEIEDRLIIEINNPKFNCIYTRMTNSGNHLFSQVIGPFGLSNDNNLVFRDAQNRPSSGMCSEYPTWDGCTRITDVLDGEISIYINFNGNPHSLELAATILHEGIHAAIASFMNACGVDVSLLNSKELIEAYSLYTTNKSADHAYIVNNYIQPIANALKSIDSLNREFDFYKAMAWGGLRDIGRQLGFSSEEMLEGYSLKALDYQDDCE